jgi:hypothetical protein
VGVLQPQSSPADLSAVSQLFTNYINGENSPVVATGLSAIQSDGTTVSWLTEGIQALKLNVPFKPTAPINPIKAISIGEFDLAFSPETPWTPLVQSNTVQASMRGYLIQFFGGYLIYFSEELPFGFGISIGQIQNTFNLTSNGQYIAGLSTVSGLSLRFGPDFLMCLT